MFKKIYKYIIVLIIGLFIGFMINVPSCEKLDPITIKIPVIDTIYVDSIRIVEKTKIKYINTIDTFYLTSKQDTVYINNLPIEHKNYRDTIKTDSTSTEINIEYHGFSSGIDNIYLKHDYYNTTKIIPLNKKNVSPFLFIEGGPELDYTFKKVNGLSIGGGAGIYIKDSWGLGASYNYLSGYLDHTIKVQLYKKF